jgi:hypothetical protein
MTIMLSLIAATLTGVSPSGAYFCGTTFTFPILVGEHVLQAEKPKDAFILSMKQGEFAFRETDYSVPADAKPVRDRFGVKVYAVTEGKRAIGYILSVNDIPTKTIVMGSAFTGNDSDWNVIGRFNFHPNRPPECKLK